MAVNKVEFGNTTVMDISDSTVTPESLVRGVVAYNAAGERIVGVGDFVSQSDFDELKFAVEGLGEPFRVHDFVQTINLSIPSIMATVANTSIPNVDIDLDIIDPIGALKEEYAIAGLAKYEVYDSASGGNRLNVTPVCTFSMSGQRILRVRMMAAGQTSVTARRIQGALLLKHR